jgi:thiamine pyrophosphate-dependent acetolactate synthase large subunit-like protein
MEILRRSGVASLRQPGTTELPFLDSLPDPGSTTVAEATAVAAADGYAQAF